MIGSGGSVDIHPADIGAVDHLIKSGVACGVVAEQDVGGSAAVVVADR
jgi:hypothetical protein